MNYMYYFMPPVQSLWPEEVQSPCSMLIKVVDFYLFRGIILSRVPLRCHSYDIAKRPYLYDYTFLFTKSYDLNRAAI